MSNLHLEWTERERLQVMAHVQQQAARIEKLEKALRPFACKCSVKGMGAGGNCTRGYGKCYCWNARAALEGKA